MLLRSEPHGFVTYHVCPTLASQIQPNLVTCSSRSRAMKEVPSMYRQCFRAYYLKTFLENCACLFLPDQWFELQTVSFCLNWPKKNCNTHWQHFSCLLSSICVINIFSCFFSLSLFAVAIWPVTGQGFQNTKWPAVLYSQ